MEEVETVECEYESEEDLTKCGIPVWMLTFDFLPNWLVQMAFVFLLVLSAKIAASMYIDTFPPETLKKQALKRSSSRMGAFVKVNEYDEN